ncbi:MAG TPA: histidine kinase [Usitatibacter sp.]|nr:histidine kinase [Usitatibacter sp.]
MKAFFFVVRHAFRWFALIGAMLILWKENGGPGRDWVYLLAIFIPTTFALVNAFSHVQRVRLIAGRADATTLGSRHRRQIEMPFPADEAFEMVDAAIRDLPYVDAVETARDSLQVRARVRRMDPYMSGKKGPRPSRGAQGARRNQVLATVTPGDRTASLTLICEPEGGAWVDWFMVDDGTNLENIEAITRALTRRVAERRKGEEAMVRQTSTEKELTVARLSLLHAQVEPHFLYNTLASAQVLTRTDPMRADQMLGYLIAYLRNSLPRTEEAPSTLGEELDRTHAYLEILRIRMGERLRVQIEVPEALKAVPVPPMMLQTLVENAIKHGLEPVPGGGTIWIIARESDGRVAITVADDGRGFSEEGGGTGIGLKNVRERLRLAYADNASFTIVANFPKGVAATITVPK